MYRQRYAAPVPDGFPSGITPTAAGRNIDLLKGAEGFQYLYRINCGGDAFTDEFGQPWQADDTLYSHSWGQDFEGVHPFQASQRHIQEDIRGTKSDELFQFFRFGRHRLWYNFPVADGDYRVELYFVEPWHGKDGGEKDDYEGIRIFDVAINDETVIDDLDPWAEAGYLGSLKRVVYAKAKKGHLHISFPEVKAGQAVICGIAISTAEANSPLSVLRSPLSWRAFDTDTIAKLPKEELPQDTEVRPASVYQPMAKQNNTFVIKPGLGQEYALRFRYKNTSGAPIKARMTITDSKRTVLVDRDITFPTTPNKFKMLSTTTGTQINAGTYTVKIETQNILPPEGRSVARIEFKELEIQ
jgi:hypothetical protein